MNSPIDNLKAMIAMADDEIRCASIRVENSYKDGASDPAHFYSVSMDRDLAIAQKRALLEELARKQAQA